MADEKITRIGAKDRNDGGLFVLVTEWRDRASMNCEQIRGLVELMHLYRAEAGFSVDSSNALLTGLNLIEKLTKEVEDIIDTAPAVGQRNEVEARPE